MSPPGGPRTPEELQFIDRERRVRVSNYILTGGFVALMLGVLVSTGDRSATATLAATGVETLNPRVMRVST